jgi:hypothetical protein
VPSHSSTNLFGKILRINKSGTILINDVGENAWEEINWLKKGAHYGWPVHEGVANDPPYVDPIFAYGYDGDPATPGCSITGGAFLNPTAVLFPQSMRATTSLQSSAKGG